MRGKRKAKAGARSKNVKSAKKTATAGKKNSKRPNALSDTAAATLAPQKQAMMTKARTKHKSPEDAAAADAEDQEDDERDTVQDEGQGGDDDEDGQKEEDEQEDEAGADFLNFLSKCHYVLKLLGWICQQNLSYCAQKTYLDSPLGKKDMPYRVVPPSRRRGGGLRVFNTATAYFWFNSLWKMHKPCRRRPPRLGPIGCFDFHVRTLIWLSHRPRREV
jgi:hypothetical protein